MLVVGWHRFPKTAMRLVDSPGFILLVLLLLGLVGIFMQIGLLEKAKKKLER